VGGNTKKDGALLDPGPLDLGRDHPARYFSLSRFSHSWGTLATSLGQALCCVSYNNQTYPHTERRTDGRAILSVS
jgi:hypothetical protein